jgi:aldehyde dehydrogenase (NAD+)
MEQEQIEQLFKRQKEYFSSGETQKYHYRKTKLTQLLNALDHFEQDIFTALDQDLNKSIEESYLSEISFLKNEINYTINNLKKWMRPLTVPTPLTLFPSRSQICPEPLGVVLIISPWNYPFQLLISPLIGALAAGNTAILKPSEVSSHTAKLVFKLIQKIFKPEEVAVVEGAIKETQMLLEQPFDHIFYTGNATVAKIIMKKAAQHLTPVTLELGGKSPCFVFGEGNLSMTAKRIAWGKFFNCGQTCVAPDYILVEKKIREELVHLIKYWIGQFYGKVPIESREYGKIINQRHLDRLLGLLEGADIIHGGEVDKKNLRLAPTLVLSQQSDNVMKEEIFGPILPILEFDKLNQAVEFVKGLEKPLACYVFSHNKQFLQKVTREVSAGGVCINDTVVHLSNHHLPFGGVGNSGMGAYHGYFSFKTFSHFKPILRRWFQFDVGFRYPPYQGKLKLLKRIMG